jgi:hypothetical protein
MTDPDRAAFVESHADDLLDNWTDLPDEEGVPSYETLANIAAKLAADRIERAVSAALQSNGQWSSRQTWRAAMQEDEG